MRKSLEGKTALVTGGSHGIGLAIAQNLLNLGCRVGILSSSEERLIEATKYLSYRRGDLHSFQCDVLESQSINSAWNDFFGVFGNAEILINNVGGGGRWGHEDILQTPQEVWEQVHQKNFGAAVSFTQKALPGMLAAGYGRVVTVTSVYGEIIAGRPWFNVAKVSQSVLMRNLASKAEYARAGVTFNSVAPGAIMIPETGWAEMAELEPQKFVSYVESLPLGRLGTPGEVAAVVSFLCSREASLVNGASIRVDGGESTSFP